MSFCGSPNGKITDPNEMKIFIHEFFDEEEQPSIEVGKEVRKCLKEYSDKFKIIPLSEIIKDENKTEQLKKLLQIGKKRLPRLPQPTELQRETSEEMFDPLSDNKIGPLSNKKIKDLTVDDILSTDGLAYIEQAIKLIEEKEKKTKGGTQRRRNKNTRRRRRRSTSRK